MTNIPGGRLISGIGGRIYVNQGPIPNDELSGTYFDVTQWSLMSENIMAECTHSGTWGAISRRLVGFDFRFSASIPFDYDKPPETLLGYYTSVAVRLNIGDVTQDPIAMGDGQWPSQKFYFAPSAYLERVHTILNAARDVVRQEVIGVGNSLIYLLPDYQSGLGNYDQYISYLRNQGWLN